MSKHAIDRAMQRYGIALDVPLVREQIRTNKAKMIERISKQKAIYQVNHHYTPLLVLYHRKQQVVITVLPATHFSSRAEAFREIHLQDQIRIKNIATMDKFNREKQKENDTNPGLCINCSSQCKQTFLIRLRGWIISIIKK